MQRLLIRVVGRRVNSRTSYSNSVAATMIYLGDNIGIANGTNSAHAHGAAYRAQNVGANIYFSANQSRAGHIHQLMLLHINVICDNTHINYGHRALIYPTGYIISSQSLNIQILSSTKLTATGNLSLYLTGARAFINGLQNVLILAAASHKLLILQIGHISLSSNQGLISQLLYIGG